MRVFCDIKLPFNSFQPAQVILDVAKNIIAAVIHTTVLVFIGQAAL